jgi:hypothetical protein
MQKPPDPLSEAGKMRRKTMRTTVFLAAAAQSLGVGSAYAGEIAGITPDCRFRGKPSRRSDLMAPTILI